jgi:type II secretory pathway pseudopilin PulG
MSTTHRRRSVGRRSRLGLTLVELTVSIMVLTFAICAATSTVITTGALNQDSHETEIARRAAENQIEVLRNANFTTVFASYDADPGDDPNGVGTAPGNLFAVAGLTPRAGAPGGRCGRIVFPSAGPSLRENTVDATLGLPRDLNADGVVDAGDHFADYRVLPVRVRVEWTGKSGRRALELTTLLSGL